MAMRVPAIVERGPMPRGKFWEPEEKAKPNTLVGGGSAVSSI